MDQEKEKQKELEEKVALIAAEKKAADEAMKRQQAEYEKLLVRSF